jgi:drug/metabolite transporter (DMT)-like permease
MSVQLFAVLVGGVLSSMNDATFLLHSGIMRPHEFIIGRMFVIGFATAPDAVDTKLNNKFFIVVLRALLVNIGTLIYFHAIELVGIGFATSILFVSPGLSCFLALLFLGEVPSSYQSAAMAISGIGVVLILKPPWIPCFSYLANKEHPSSTGVMLLLLCAVCDAMQNVLSRATLSGGGNPSLLQFTQVVMSFVCLPFLKVDLSHMMTVECLSVVISSGIMTCLVNHINLDAMCHHHLSVVLALRSSGVASSFLVDSLLFDRLTDDLSMLGVSLIVVSCVIISTGSELCFFQRRSEMKAAASWDDNLVRGGGDAS